MASFPASLRGTNIQGEHFVRKLLVAAGIAAATCSLGAFSAVHADTQPGGIEGCIATSPGANSPQGTLYDTTCSYTATRTGGYATSAQTWTVTIYSDAAMTKPVASFSSAAGSPPCNTGPIIQPGQTVKATVNNGVNAVGNPIPSATNASSTDQCTSAP
jgi:hypothetical protein